MLNKLGLPALCALMALPSVALAQEVSLHGFDDVSVKNDYITPRGLVVTTAGATMQSLNGLVIDMPQKQMGIVSDVSLVGGTWTDWNPGYDPAYNTSYFNEFDWFVGVNAVIGKDWIVGAQYVEFISPQEAFNVERNVEFKLAFNDANYFKTLVFQPYVKLFYAVEGSSTVVTGKAGGTFDVEIGATPALDLHSYGLPLIVSAPTWLTVGPSDFWGGGGNVGVLSTGVKLTYPLPFIPGTAGHWAVYAGYQYYDLINPQLVLAESLLNGRSESSANLWHVGMSVNF